MPPRNIAMRLSVRVGVPQPRNWMPSCAIKRSLCRIWVECRRRPRKKRRRPGPWRITSLKRLADRAGDARDDRRHRGRRKTCTNKVSPTRSGSPSVPGLPAQFDFIRTGRFASGKRTANPRFGPPGPQRDRCAGSADDPSSAAAASVIGRVVGDGISTPRPRNSKRRSRPTALASPPTR